MFGDSEHIVTNYHVIRGADEVFIQQNERGEEVAVEVVGFDAESDIAVLKVKYPKLIEGKLTLKPIKVADSDYLKVGDVILAIGNPFGIGKTVTKGIISALNRNNLGINTFEDFIQIDAAINQGNSGGALIDVNGNLVGINSAIFSSDGSFSGLAFAIPTNMLSQIVEQIKDFGQAVRGWAGIQITELNEAVSKGLNIEHGVVIATVIQKSPAQRAGLEVGDIVLEVDGSKVSNSRDLINFISSVRPGSNVSFKIYRKTQEIMINLTVMQRPTFIR